MESYVAWYRDPRTGANVRIYTQADSIFTAKTLFEGQYGAANVWGICPA
jgi:hypothetical protein